MCAKAVFPTTFTICWLVVAVQGAQESQDSKQSDPMKVKTERFTVVVNRILNEALSFEEVEEFVQTRLKVTGQKMQHSVLLDKLLKDIKAKLLNLTEPVHLLKAVVQKFYFGFAHQGADVNVCCRLGIDTKEDVQHKTRVNVNNMCVTHPPSEGREDDKAKYAGRDVLHQFLTNGGYGATVQYYGTEDGILHLQPATKLDKCRHYDPRFANWYIAATSVQKDIVIAIDISAQMGTKTLDDENLLTVAKKLVKIIVRTLLYSDQFAVFGFNSDGIKLPKAKEDCFTNTLGEATNTNRKRMYEFVDSLTARGTTNYKGGLEKAIALLQSHGKHGGMKDRDKVLVFISGTTPLEKEGDLVELIKVAHAQDPSNHIRVVCLGVGLKPNDLASALMKKMIETSRKKKGFFYNVETSDRPVSHLRRMYRYLSIQKVNYTIMSEVYADFINHEPVITIASPVIHNGNLVGVVGTDIAVSQLFFFKQLVSRYEKSYLFVMRRGGNVALYHPLLPLPPPDGSALVHGIELLEREADKQGIIAQMVQMPTGFARAEAYRTMTSGNVYRDGIQQRQFASAYFWQSFYLGDDIQTTRFTICLVLYEDETESLLNFKVPLTGAPFIYHIYKDPLATRECRYFRRVALSDTTGLRFSKDAFAKPVEDFLKTTDGSRDYAAVLKPRVYESDKKQTLLEDNVLESVEITHKADLEWIWNQKRLGVTYAVWRFIAILFGVQRFYPTIRIPKHFSAKDADWYQRAISSPGKLMSSPPALDPMGAGFVITFSKALTSNMTVKNQPKRNRILGVMAVAITVEYLDTMLQETFELCKPGGFICFVIDESGYIVVHSHFVTPPTFSAEIPWIENVHITNKEPEIAKDLILKKYMLHTSCTHLETLNRHTTFKMQENASMVDNTNSDPTYYMERMAGTNMYLVLRTPTLEIPTPCYCTNKYGTETSECNDNKYVVCKCPCYTKSHTAAMCDDKSIFKDDRDWKVCTPLAKTIDADLVDIMSEESKELRMLLPCFEYRCKYRLNITTCHNYVGCRWCNANIDGNLLKTPHCDTYDKCYYGRENYPSPYPARADDFLVTNIVLATIIVILVVTAALVTYCQNKIESERRVSLEDLASKLKYLKEAHGRGQQRDTYTNMELKEWQRRKKRLEKAEKAARRKKHRVYKDKNWTEPDHNVYRDKDWEEPGRQSIGTFKTLEEQKEQCKQQ